MLKGIGRVVLAMVAVAIAGGLIGVGAEEIAFRRDAREDEAVMATQSTDALPLRGPTAQEREVVRRATEGLPPYGDAAPQPLAADYLGPSSPVAAAWFETNDDAETVLGFYRARLLAQGIPVLEDHTGPASGYVGYRNPRTHEVHLVTAVGEERGVTRVFISNATVEALRTGASELPPELPHPPGVESPMVMTFRREGEVQSSVVASVPRASVAGLLAFYREAYARDGWTLDDVRSDASGATVESHRDGMHALTRLRQTDGNDVELFAQLVESNGRSPR